MIHTPDVVTLTGDAAEVLVAQEAEQIDVVARVLASLAVLALGGAGFLVAVVAIDTSSTVPLLLLNLALAQGGHGDSIGGIEGLELGGSEIGGLHQVGFLGSDGPGSQAGEEEGSDSGLHVDWRYDGIGSTRGKSWAGEQVAGKGSSSGLGDRQP